jgi:hypothetical protein
MSPWTAFAVGWVCAYLIGGVAVWALWKMGGRD